MKELEDIVRAYEIAQANKLKTALATVVHVQGSSYRRPGARMLVTENGELTGAISGGCLEGDALRKARLAMLQQKKMLITYDTSDEDDVTIGVGLGCNGIIQILIEPVDPTNPANPVAMLQAFLKERQVAVLITLFSMENRSGDQPGTCFFLSDKHAELSTQQDNQAQETLYAEAREALESKTSLTKTYELAGSTFTGFVEVLVPQLALVIVGAGNDARPLVSIASLLGWNITVVDGRANYLTAARFPAAHKLLLAKPEQVLDQIQLDEQTVFVLMTHNYNYEIALLRLLLPLSWPYVGVLGPRKKLDRMLQELEEDGCHLPERALKHLHGPVGLDIGAETSEEIALSILSEIKAVLADRPGSPLRAKNGPIHEYTSEITKSVQSKELIADTFTCSIQME
ncbi:XdhC family protein [Pontibacter qinzhouensis]|uniref:XdhC family protein n=1 Tax=Pontibacter qinzhouensis TaxID=2603253 RepID=A0A5C8JHA7_9BACT|nr:XdhC/CoxI family protein [Pontibacter qinzhouensis]TXK37008.1 XdhC family protein [Pontibacter qinzhouensis]